MTAPRYANADNMPKPAAKPEAAVESPDKPKRKRKAKSEE